MTVAEKGTGRDIPAGGYTIDGGTPELSVAVAGGQLETTNASSVILSSTMSFGQEIIGGSWSKM